MANNKKTPLLQQLRENSGTVYVFPSASEDIGLNINNDVYGVALTHFALLDIPAIPLEKLCFGKDSNLYNLNLDIDDINGNQLLAMSLQNYVMNFETLLLNQDNYNYQNLDTVSERVFWHWMKAIGAFNTEEALTVSTDKDTYWYHLDNDFRVVKCFGSIDSGNKVHSEFGMFNETYINIPSSYGSGPVFFKQQFDENYYSGSFTPENPAYLEGRSDNDYISYSNNHDKPYFDNDSNQYVIVAPDNTNKVSLFEGLVIEKDFDNLADIINTVTKSEKKYPILSYDEINVDPHGRLFDKLNVENFDIEINGYLSQMVKTEFNYNAILLYYSVYDQNDVVSRVHATNLFGIVFLDSAHIINGTDTNGEQQLQLSIPTLHKRKSTPDKFGTGYSFRINIKTLSVYDDTDGIIQDNTTTTSVFSEDMNSVIQALNNAIGIMNTNVYTTSKIQQQYTNILHIYDQQQLDINDISTLLNNYVEGRTNPVINVDQLYTDDIFVKSPNQYELRFNVPMLLDEGQDDYTANYTVAASITANGFFTDTIYDTDTYGKHYYVIADTFAGDYPITTDPKQLISSGTEYSNTLTSNMLNEAVNLVHSMFEPVVSGDRKSLNYYLKVNLKCDTTLNDAGDEDVDERYKFDLYVDPNSPLMNQENSGLRHLTSYYAPDTATGDNYLKVVNYTGLIPYIIAELQLLNQYSYNQELILDIISNETDKSAENLSLRQAITYAIWSTQELNNKLNQYQEEDVESKIATAVLKITGDTNDYINNQINVVLQDKIENTENKLVNDIKLANADWLKEFKTYYDGKIEEMATTIKNLQAEIIALKQAK